MAKTSKKHPLTVASGAKPAALNGRTEKRHKHTHKRWTEVEIKRLSDLAPNGKPLSGTWDDLAVHFPGRSGKQCRERSKLSQQLLSRSKKGMWSLEEEELLATLQSEIGNKWTTIAESIGRSEGDVKNRWYSLQRQQKRRMERAAQKHGVEQDHNDTNTKNPSLKKEASRRKVAANSPIDTPPDDVCDFLKSGSIEFADDPFIGMPLPLLPPLPNNTATMMLSETKSAPTFMSNLDADAAASLVHIKRGQILPTPTANKYGHSPAGVKQSSAESGDSEPNKENVSPMILLGSSQVYSRQHIPITRKFTYPPPPSVKYSVTGTPTPVVQAVSGDDVKAGEIFSPSYIDKQYEKLTPSTALPLDSLPLCDSIPYKTTPMQGDENRHEIVLSAIDSSSTQEFTPLPFTETPSMTYEPELFERASNVLQGNNSKNTSIRLPCYSPLISSPPGATAV